MHTFHVRAVAVAGNRDSSVASHGWTVQGPVTVRQSAGLRIVKVTWHRSTVRALVRTDAAVTGRIRAVLRVRVGGRMVELSKTSSALEAGRTQAVFRLRGKTGKAHRAVLTLAYPGDKSYAPEDDHQDHHQATPLHPGLSWSDAGCGWRPLAGGSACSIESEKDGFLESRGRFTTTRECALRRSLNAHSTLVAKDVTGVASWSKVLCPPSQARPRGKVHGAARPLHWPAGRGGYRAVCIREARDLAASFECLRTVDRSSPSEWCATVIRRWCLSGAVRAWGFRG